MNEPKPMVDGPTELTKANEWLASMMARASPGMQSIIESHIRDIGVLKAYSIRGHLEAQMEYIESL